MPTLATTLERIGRTTIDMPGRLASVLTWPAPSGAYRRLGDPLAPGNGVRARIESIVPESPRAATIVIHPGRGWRPHRPGQWVSVGVEIDGVRHQRCYSITSLPATPARLVGPGTRSADVLTITVQSVPDGIVSNHLVNDARPGDIVHLDGPDGDFTLTEPSTPMGSRRDGTGTPTDAPARLMITGGSGITPVIGMLRALDAGLAGAVGDITVVHHAPSQSEMLFAHDLKVLERRHLGVEVHLIATGDGAPPPELEITARRLDELCADWRDRETWVCGPRPLVDAVSALWDDPTSLTTAPMHVERFTPTLAPDHDAVAGTVTFARSGCDAPSDGATTVLDLAESAGLTPVSGCRMGICRRCITPLESGAVQDLRDGGVVCEPGTHVRICVSAPVGDATFDL